MAAAIFLQLAQRMTHRDAVAVGDVVALQLRGERGGVGIGQRHRLDVGQPAPRIAAGGVQAQGVAVLRRGFIETPQVRQSIAKQYRRGHEFRR